jgi:hypothetical protein
VDELHLFVYPVARGKGERFWGESYGPTRLVLRAQDVYDNGVVHQAYGPAEESTVGQPSANGSLRPRPTEPRKAPQS